MDYARVDTWNVRPLRPLRVLVAARDARFVRVAGFLLGRRGFEVETVRRPSRVVETASRIGADVVILDGTDALAEAERALAALEALDPHLTVVVVADDPPEGDHESLRILPKWTSLEQLVLNLEALHLGSGSA
jgi:CheY-like chemotaxis protein